MDTQRIELADGHYLRPSANPAHGFWVLCRPDDTVISTGWLRRDAEEFAGRITGRVQNVSRALDNAIEQITAQTVHGEVSNEGWQTTLNELVAAQAAGGVQ